LHAAEQACHAAQDQLSLAQVAEAVPTINAAAVMRGGWALIGDIHTQFVQLGAEVQRTSSEISQVLLQAQLSAAQTALEAELAQRQLTTRFGTARRYHAYDIWRARALLDSARRYSIAARRSIESHFVVDLSSMLSPEPFVAAPAEWADEAYEYDLSAPAAVGLTRSQPNPDGIYPNRLSDYVRNLESFVAGYSVARPTSIARSDSEVVALPGPDVHVTVTVDDMGQEVEVVRISSDSSQWTFFCEDDGVWISHPGIGQPGVVDLATACDGEPPSRARTSFHLDPWARLRRFITEPPDETRHNVRWAQLAVNVVGTGVLDCQRALDPLDCYSEPFIRYSFRHLGPAWTTNFAGEWRALDVPTSVIESGKALTAEEWLDPIVNAWNQPFVQAVARSEFSGRPVGGDYELELTLPPEVRPERIERIQVLEQLHYWVKQIP
jgi:hypothetical protein